MPQLRYQAVGAGIDGVEAGINKIGDLFSRTENTKADINPEYSNKPKNK